MNLPTFQPRPSLRRGIHKLVSAAVVTSTFLLTTSEAQGQVDLVAQLINGPGMAHVDQDILVTVSVGNDGDALRGDFTLELILSDDFTLGDADDVVVGSDTSSLLGPRGVIANVPVGVPDVQHFWALRVLPVGGEVVTNNNEIFGSAVNVISTDLVLDDPTPIDVFMNNGQGAVTPIPVIVSNGGTSGSILIFSVDEVTPEPWISVDPPSSFAIAGEPGNEISISIIPELLSPGVNNATLRFSNFQDPIDVHDLSVTVTVGAARVNPGDRVFGQISSAGETDEFVVTAVAGERLFFTSKIFAGNLKPVLTIIDPDGAVEKILKFKGASKKGYKVKKSGEYRVVIAGKKTTLGVYSIKTKGKLPKSARARKLKIKGLAQGAVAAIDVMMLPGATLEFAADPNGKFTGPLFLGFADPAGAVFDVSGNTSTAATGEVVVEDLQINETGAWGINLGGFGGAKKEKVKLSILPFQPPAGKGKIYLK